MSGSLRRHMLVAGLIAVATVSTAAQAADNSASWTALSAMTASAAQAPGSPALASNGLPAGGFATGAAFVPMGIVIATAVLGVVLAVQHGHRGGRGFSPS